MLAHLEERQTWSLQLLRDWQHSLRGRARNLWLPHRFWYDLVHRANLSYEPPLIKLSLGGLLTREMRLQDADHTAMYRPAGNKSELELRASVLLASTASA